jgi:hypothetical protein
MGLSRKHRRRFSSLALSIMAAVPTDAVAPDPQDLRDELVFEIMELRGDLKGLGYDMDDLPDFLKEIRAMALEAQIQKLRKQAERMRQLLKKKAHSNSPNALLSASAPSNWPSGLLPASAPSADALTTCGKKVNKRRRGESASGSFPGNRISYEDPGKREENAEGRRKDNARGSFLGKRFSYEPLARAPAVPQHGACCCHSHLQKSTYKTAEGFAEFIFDAVTRNCIQIIILEIKHFKLKFIMFYCL